MSGRRNRARWLIEGNHDAEAEAILERIDAERGNIAPMVAHIVDVPYAIRLLEAERRYIAAWNNRRRRGELRAAHAALRELGISEVHIAELVKGRNV